MSNSKYNWEKIIEDCTKIMSESISKGENIPSTFPGLYKLLQSKYTNEEKQLPSQNTFRQFMHNRLKIGHNQKNVRGALYKLAGKYDEMTLQMLSDNIIVSTDNNINKSAWLFIRLKNIKTIKDRTIHFYYLANKIKEKFKHEVLFISFDIDTLVIMCVDNNSRKKILSYFSCSLKNIADFKKETEM